MASESNMPVESKVVYKQFVVDSYQIYILIFWNDLDVFEKSPLFDESFLKYKCDIIYS